MSRWFSRVHWILLSGCLACLPAFAEANECSAQIAATLSRQDDTQLQFEVSVRSDAECASIEYDLVVEERLANGQTHRVRKVRNVKLSDGSLTEIVDFSLTPGGSALSYDTSLVWCRSCDQGDGAVPPR